MLKSRIINDGWKRDANLLDDLTKMIANRWQLKYVLLIVKRDYPLYAWSLITLKRRLKHFNLRMIDECITPGQIGEALAEELVNVGGDLGFRAMTKKIRVKHHLNVKERDVLEAMK